MTTETTTESTTESTTDPSAGGPSGADPGHRRTLPIVLAALLLVSVAAVGVLAWQTIGADRTRASRDEAVAAARDEVAQVLSYDSKTLDADLARSRAPVSGTFSAQFNDLINQVIGPAVRQQNMATKAQVLRAAPTQDVRPDQVTVLMFVKQTNTMTGQPQPQETTNQLTVTVTRVGDRWLISNLQPL
ncbi:MAG TPA: hypothetical protein VGH99_21375 [Pseudonocardia sp.]